jgi:DNA-binding MarR family transcriptional regulator|tara:strand:+ start:702 stop:1031 length:330 start_codon:yes stop_codon:yes gene_type:complete
MINGLNLLKIIEEMRKFDSHMESQTIAVFFYVCLYSGADGVSMQTISQKLDIAQSSVSRNCYKLGDRTRDGIGIGLLQSFEDPEERRRKLVRLTAKGRRVFNTLSDMVK